MVACGARKERTHHTGISNRTKDGGTKEPIHFDATMRSTAPQTMRFHCDLQVPATNAGEGNMDFHPRLAGLDYRQPNSMPKSMRRLMKTQSTMTSSQEQAAAAEEKAATVKANPKDEPRQEKQKAFQAPSRWHARHWYAAPNIWQAPLQKEEGETWNSKESQNIQGEIKGHDRLFRSVRRPEDVMTPMSDVPGGSHPMNFDREEYYPGRSEIEAHQEHPTSDFQIRPVNLPDFAVPPPANADPISRMARVREVIRQRYAGRPGLIRNFRNVTLSKNGFAFPKDIQQVLDQMGIKISDDEADMLVSSVDKDRKGAVTFEEFADLVYGPSVKIDAKPHEAKERHVRHVTKTLVDSLIVNGSALGRAFCEADPERRYLISKPQFMSALGTACNHVSAQAAEFLWAAQFPGENEEVCHDRCIDWRGFMSQLAHFAHENRQPTPGCVQGRKRQYDLLQRTVPITGGRLTDLDLNRPDQDVEDEVHIVAGKLVQRENKLPNLPRDAALLTESYIEEIRVKASRVEQALPQRVGKARLKELLKNREFVHQDELVNLLCTELERPHEQGSLTAQPPIYSPPGGDAAAPDPGQPQDKLHDSGPKQADLTVPQDGPSCLRMVRADIEAYTSTCRMNRDHEIEVKGLIEEVYRPPHERKAIEKVNDGLNRNLRKHRPPRERAPTTEVPRYENYWQARYLMDALNDAVACMECSNGGKIKPSKVFKRLDVDGDGWISLADLMSACGKYKVPHDSKDLHALFSALDVKDVGAVDIGEFTRNFEIYDGSVMDKLARPIRAVYHEGGVEYGGPIQDRIDAREETIQSNHLTAELAQADGQPNGRSTSAPPGTASKSDRTVSDRAGMKSPMAQSGRAIITPMVYDDKAALITGRARISDVIRARTSQWKPHKAELYTTMPPTRYGMTYYPDTRHVHEPSVPLTAHYMHDSDRFKTTNQVLSVFAAPDHRHPQTEDQLKRHARNEYRVERIRSRAADFRERCQAAEEAAQTYDEHRVARKALNQLNYERRCQMACC
mmetsp:Transcript_12254/g.27789  ORF Transcript_12254/g.27789 Transcript_12254/m.27789 type:complete len:1019 (-) Transcript_12254:121-3177(-)